MTWGQAGALTLLAIFLTSPAAQAKVADLTKASCAQLMSLPQGERGQLIIWLHGYYAGAAQRAVIDRSKLEDARTAIEQACERSRALPLIGVEARAIFLGEPMLQAPASPPTASPGQSATPSR